MPGVVWARRSNPARVRLGFAEIAVVELASTFPTGVEADLDETVARVTELVADGQVN